MLENINVHKINPRELINDYLKLIYSPSFSNVYKKNGGPLSQINFNELEIEQQARHRNLFVFLKMSKAPFFDVINEEELREMLVKYCDHDLFWTFKGRTILENFCIFLHSQSRYQSQKRTLDIIKISGIISGIFENARENSTKSPWKNNKVEIVRNSSTDFTQESFVSYFKLNNIFNPLTNLNNEEEIKSNKKYLIILKLIDKKKMELISEELL